MKMITLQVTLLTEDGHERDVLVDQINDAIKKADIVDWSETTFESERPYAEEK